MTTKGSAMDVQTIAGTLKFVPCKMDVVSGHSVLDSTASPKLDHMFLCASYC